MSSMYSNVGKEMVSSWCSRRISVEFQSNTAKECSPSRPALPASWKYASGASGMSMCTTKRTSGLSIPIPKALVQTITLVFPLFQSSWRFILCSWRRPAW